MKERNTPQALRSREKKQAIFEIAMQMFEEYGYEQTTVRDICRNAGITTSSFYNFFGDKLGVLLQFYYEILARGACHLELTEDNLAQPYQSLCDYFTSIADFCDRFGKDVVQQAVISVPRLTAGGYDALPRDSGIRQIQAFLEAGKDAGTVAPGADCRGDAEYLLMGAHGVLMYWITLTQGESYRETAARLLPRVFSAVTDRPIRVRTAEGTGREAGK